jgi:Fur family peroxide stress response transcriptional regulator
VLDQSHIRTLFEEHGLRCTRQREVLYQALAATKSHPTADELFNSVKEDGLSLATIYNTLDAFTEVGLVRRIPSSSGSGPCRFDADTTDHVHLATPDGRVHDVPNDLSRQLLAGIPASSIADLERRMGIKVAGLTVQVTARTQPA